MNPDPTIKGHWCPVCGKYYFEDAYSYEICPVCGWEDSFFQEAEPDEEGDANVMSLNEAREAYLKGLPVE